MNRAVMLAVPVSGIVLVVYGVAVANSFSSDLSRFFNGVPTDKTIWLLVGGIVAIVVGGGWSPPSRA